MKKLLCLFLKLVTVLIILFSESLSQWTQTSLPSGYYIRRTIGISDSYLFISIDNRIYCSVDTGTTWTQINTTGTSITSLAAYFDYQGNRNIFVGTNGTGVFRYIYTNEQCNTIYNSLKNQYITSICVFDTTLYVGTPMSTFISGKNDSDWIAPSWPSGGVIVSSAILDSFYFAGLQGGVFSSTNKGKSWSFAGLAGSYINDLAISGTSLFAGTLYEGVFCSTDNGLNWNNMGLSERVSTLAVSTNGSEGDKIFVGTYDHGVFLSNNNGASWTAVNSGLSDNSIDALTVFGNMIFAQTDKKGVWKRPLTEFITSVKQKSGPTLNKFILYQNYPNPFNPSTTISFSLPSKSVVSLNIYDLLGRELATVFSEEMLAGNHYRIWNATNIPSGIYFYRLQAGSFTETKILILLK